MATVYSLVCWGGKDGKTVTMTIASPCVVSLTNHGLQDGTGVVFSTTGALPTGVTAGTTYYSRSTASGTFNLYDTEAHAKDTGSTTGRVNTSGSQSGTHTAKGAYYLGLTTEQKARYGSSGTERIYSGLVAWHTAQSSTTTTLTVEVCEIGEAFTDYNTSEFFIALSCAAAIITTEINGARSGAFHDGSLSTGYVFSSSAGYAVGLGLSVENACLDGLRVEHTAEGGRCVGLYAPKYRLLSCIIRGTYAGGWKGQTGVSMTSVAGEFANNSVLSCDTGISVSGYSGEGTAVYNNLVAKCGTGWSASTEQVNGQFLNNISVGNTKNWSTAPSGSRARAGYNLGASGDTPWYIGADTGIKTGTTGMFVDYANNDFRPASSSSPQVESGTAVFDGLESDIVGAVRPNYVSATHPSEAWDIGPFEFDHGEGLAPSSVPISITGMASGSEIAIYKASDMSQILAPQSTTGSYSGTYTYTGDTNIIVRVRKGTAAARYLPYEYTGTITSTGFQLVVSQIPDTIAQ